jgi:ABC-type branched-subunit amino acid transport system ATPase component
MQSILALRKVAKSFGSLHIIKEANLDVTPFERHAIIGPNGAGKSTLFNLISGRMPPSSGRIFLKGKDIAGLEAEDISRLGLGRSFQISNIFPQMTVFENVRIGVMARHNLRYGILRLASRLREINEETEMLLDSVLLQERGKLRAGALTYSEQRALDKSSCDPSGRADGRDVQRRSSQNGGAHPACSIGPHTFGGRARYERGVRSLQSNFRPCVRQLSRHRDAGRNPP